MPISVNWCYKKNTMKQLCIFLFAIAATCTLNATVITSAANGNATNPFTWNCTCIPQDGDTIIINHAITLDVDYAFTMGGIQINAGGSVTGNSGQRIFGVSGGYFINNGTVNIGYLAHNGGTFVNNGSITVGGSLLIDQTVTLVNNAGLIVGDTVYINTNATLQNNFAMNTTELLSDGTITNPGNLTATNLFTGGTLTQTGSLILTGNLYNIGNAALNAYTEAGGNIYNAENMVITSYVKTQSFYNGDSISGTATVQNNGTVSISNSLYNSEDINGNGLFCIVDSSLNSGAINGTVDICDISGGGWDLNIGTEAGTVTHCANGPCTIGITEPQTAGMTMMPNPAHELLYLTFAQAQTGVVRITDITGRVVLEQQISGSSVALNVLTLPQGLYSVTFIGQSQSVSSRFVKE